MKSEKSVYNMIFFIKFWEFVHLVDMVSKLFSTLYLDFDMISTSVRV